MANSLLKAVQKIQPGIRGSDGFNHGPKTAFSITTGQYRYRAGENKKLLLGNLNNHGILCGSSDYYLSDGERYNCYTDTAKMFDIKGALPLGAIPHNTHHGADAVLLHRGIMRDIEIKTVTLNTRNIFCGPFGGLYSGKPGNSNKPEHRGGLQSAIHAAYDITTEECLQSKFIDTYLAIFDKISGGLIDIFALAGDDIEDIFLEKEEDGHIVYGKPKIKLSKFSERGKIVPSKEILIPKIGFENFENILAQCCPTVNIGDLIPFDDLDLKKYNRMIKKALKS